MKERKRTRALTRVALFVAVMAVCAWISIPAPLPFTMQTFGLFLCLGILGGRSGSFAVGAYLLLGLIGAPVFAGFTGGAGALFGGGGGYLVGFLFATLLFWGLEPFVGSEKGLLFRMVLSLLVCYLIGSAWYAWLYATENVGFWGVLTVCVLPYLLPDGLKLALALAVCKRVKGYRR